MSTTSDDGTGFKYNEQAEISGDPDLKEEDGGSPNRDDQSYVNGDWFVRAQKVCLVYFSHSNFIVFWQIGISDVNYITYYVDILQNEAQYAQYNRSKTASFYARSISLLPRREPPARPSPAWCPCAPRWHWPPLGIQPLRTAQKWRTTAIFSPSARASWLSATYCVKDIHRPQIQRVLARGKWCCHGELLHQSEENDTPCSKKLHRSSVYFHKYLRQFVCISSIEKIGSSSTDTCLEGNFVWAQVTPPLQRVSGFSGSRRGHLGSCEKDDRVSKMVWDSWCKSYALTKQYILFFMEWVCNKVGSKFHVFFE